MNHLCGVLMNFAAPFPDGGFHYPGWGIAGLPPALQTTAIYAGALLCVVSIIFAGTRMLDGRMSEAMPGVSGAVFGLSVCTWGAGWIPFALLARTTEATLLLLVVITVVLSRAETNRADKQAAALHAQEDL